MGFVGPLDILNFLRDSGFSNKTENDCYYLVEFFDQDEDQRLNYTEFLSLVLPCDAAKLRSEITQRSNYFVGREDFLSKSVEYELCKLFLKEIGHHNRVEKIKQEITLSYDFTPDDAFGTIDDFNLSYVDFSNLKRFMKKNGYIPTNKDLAAIIRRLDLNADSKLNKDEFIEGIKPVEPYSKCQIAQDVKNISSAKITASKLKKKFKGLKGKTKKGGKSSPRKRTANPYESPSRRSPLRKTRSPDRASMTRTLSPSRPMTATIPGQSLMMERYSPRMTKPMHYGEERELVSYLRDLMRLESDLEQAKCDLAAKPDFNLVDCFKLFDESERGWSTFEGFREGLSGLGIFPAMSDLELLFNRYDRDNAGTHRYSEFCDMFTPKNPEYSSMLNSRPSYYILKTYYRKDEYFHPDTRISLENLFRTHLSVETQAESIRQQLRLMPRFDLFEAFKTCDMSETGFITPHEMRTLFENHGFYVTPTEVNGLLDRFDQNKDGRVSYTEFADEVRPKSPERRA